MKRWLLLLILCAALHAAVAAPDAAVVTRPTLKLTTLDGDAYDLAEHRGRWVVVNFWATWCGPCLAEIPDFSRFDQERDDVDVIGLAFEEIELDDLRAFLRKHPASYPVARVDVYAPPADFEVPRGLPTTYLIAPDGTVAKHFLGPVSSAKLARLIAQSAAPAAGG